MGKNAGKELETSIESSAKSQNIFCFRVRDVNPMALKQGKQWMIPKNKYDFIFYYKDYLFPSEIKSVKAKSISFSESMIKEYQIKSLTEASKYNGVIPIFIFNFREPDNRTFAIHIEEFNKVKHISENQLEHNYKSKLNRSSIPLRVCEEIGTEITYYKPRTRNHYYMNKLFDELVKRHGSD